MMNERQFVEVNVMNTSDLKAQWWDDLTLQEDSWFKDQKSRIGNNVFITWMLILC